MAKKEKASSNLWCGYTIYWDQGELLKHAKIKAHQAYSTAKDENDAISLLSINLEICNSISTVTH